MFESEYSIEELEDMQSRLLGLQERIGANYDGMTFYARRDHEGNLWLQFEFAISTPDDPRDSIIGDAMPTLLEALESMERVIAYEEEVNIIPWWL